MTTLEQIRTERPLTPPTKGMWKLAQKSFVSVILNPFNLGFSIAMPVAMYLMFGAAQEYGQYALANGNVSASVLVAMTLFGVMLATSSLGAAVSLERVQGISRLYALTPLSPVALVVARLVANFGVALLLILITYTVGVFTGAKMAAFTWIGTAAFVLFATGVSSAIGLTSGFVVRSDSAYAANSAVLVLSAFGSGMMLPLDQMGSFFQQLAPWTPLWGVSQLTQLPLVGWENFEFSMVLNAVAWTVLFAGAAIWGLRRDTGR